MRDESEQSGNGRVEFPLSPRQRGEGPRSGGEGPSSYALREDVIAALRDWLAQRLGFEPSEIKLDTPFAELGLDSVTAVELTRHLQKTFHVDVSPTATWDFPNIAALTGHVAASAKAEVKPAVAPLETLSESEMTALLERELKRQ